MLQVVNENVEGKKEKENFYADDWWKVKVLPYECFQMGRERNFNARKRVGWVHDPFQLISKGERFGWKTIVVLQEWARVMWERVGWICSKDHMGR